MKTMKLTTAQAIILFLKNQFISRDGKEHRLIEGVFGIFGHGNVTGIGQALEEYGGKELPFYQPKNEQAMVHTAVAFSKAKQRLGTFACTSSVGPGATNMVTGAATATINRIPVLLLPGDIFANRKPAPVLQQLEYPQSMDVSVNDCFRPVSKYWDRINRPEQILAALPEAMRILSDPAETGAVTLCLPEDVQTEAYDFPVRFFEKQVYEVTRPLPAESSLKGAIRMIRSSKRPMVVAGGGVHYSEAESALEEFCRSTGIPVGVTQAGKGSLVDSHPLCMGAVGSTGTQAANSISDDADVVICVGTRLSDFTTASKTQFKNPNVKFIGINVNASDARKLGSHTLVGDAREALTLLKNGLSGFQVSKSYAAEIASAKETWAEIHRAVTHPKKKKDAPLHQAEVIRVLNDFSDEKTTIVHAAGGLPGDLHKLWQSRDRADYHSEYGYSCMGYEIAGALGVKMAHPEREVYAFLGDGSYLMLNHEIVTSIQEGKKITVVLNDNHGYQCIHGLQRGCGGESFGNEFRLRDPEKNRLEGRTLEIDFMANAESLGARVFRAENEAELISALESARKEKKTCLIYVPIDPDGSVPGFSWWDVPIAEVSGNRKTQEARKAYQEQLKRQRFYYQGAP